MQRILLILSLVALALPVQAADIITGRLTVTNAANINSTNDYTIDVNGDTRTWTNNVVTASTQILASTNNTTAVIRLLTHFSTYEVADTELLTDGSTYVAWRGEAGAAMAVTLNTNTWGAVTYTTNTVGTAGTVVAVPYTFFSAGNQNILSDGLMNWLNIAPTNKLGSRKVTWAHSALTADSAITNFVANLTGDPFRTITAAANVHFIQSTNRPTAATNALEATFFILASGGNRTLTLNSDWKPTSSAITITNGTTGVLKVTAKGTAETDVYWSYSLLGLTTDTDTDTDDQTAAEVVSTPAGTLAANDVQEALDELDTEKEPALTDSASLRSTLSDESGTGAAIFADGALGAATATTPSADDNDTSVATTAFFQSELTDNLNTSAEVAAIVGDETGSGVLVFGTSPTITTPTISGAVAFPDGVRQTFNPDGTAAGLNVGSHTADPSAPSNGDIWYDSNNNLLRARVNGATISITGSAGGLASTDIDTSAELRGILTDESGTGALIFAGGDIAAATATTASADDNDTSVATTAFVQGEINGDTRIYEFALSDETTSITTGTAKVTWRAPHAMTVTAVRASLSTASSSGLPEVDINEGGVSIFSTRLTIDANEKTSTTAATAAVISDTAIADDAEITFDIDTAGTGAKGLKVKIYYTK